jgi:hypothetical protein
MNYKGLKLLSNELNMIWMNEQSEIKKDTDIIMSNIINKNVLSRYANYDNDKKIINKKKISEKKLQRIKIYAQQNYIKQYTNLI